MLAKWRGLRIASTLFGLLVGAGLVALALTAPRAVNSTARGLLVVLAVVLPIGMFGVFTLAGWQRSAAAGVTPPPVIARLLAWGLGPIVPIIFLFLLLGIMFQLNQALDLTH